MKMKSLQKICLSAIMAFGFIAFSGATSVQAKATQDTWSATLPTACRTTTAGTRVYNGEGASVSLTRIVNGPSYYVEAQMFNSDNEPRTDAIKVQQSAGYTGFTNNTMVKLPYETYEYTLKVSNDYFETTARSAYGYIYM